MKAAKIVKTVKEGPIYIEIREYGDGRFGFEFNSPTDGRVRVRSNELPDAEKRAQRMLKATHAAKFDRDMVSDATFIEAMALYNATRKNETVPKLVEALIASRKSKGRSEWTIRDLEELRDFEKVFPGNIRDIERDDVEKWLNSLFYGKGDREKPIGPRRWNNRLAAIKSLFRFARRDGFLSAELTGVEKIEKRRTTHRIETYSPEEFARLLRVVPEEWLPTVVLGGFCGLRPEELSPDPKTTKQGLQWENVLWEKRKIDVPRWVSKDGRRRFVPLCDAAFEFLKEWREAKGPVGNKEKRVSNFSRHWSKAAKVKWKRDGLRHSYASYRLALIHDAPRLALEMGNSVKMIHDHYLDLKHEDEAAAWFAIRPGSLALDGPNSASDPVEPA